MSNSKTEKVTPAQVNPDLEKERHTAKFNPHELTLWWEGGEEKYAEKKALEHAFLSDPDLEDKIPIAYLSHKELYEDAIRKAALITKKIHELRKINGDSTETYKQVLGSSLGSALLKEGNPFSVHFVMFMPTIMGQGTMEQQVQWLSRAWDCKIIGTYAQTELGHGTFLRGLETRADYDPSTEEFVLNSPSITSYKWWPGGLGHTANYAVVVAQLYTQGKFRGLAPFIVQLRDEETHMPMPGIDIGEIGAKLGMQNVNNGYLGFKNVRIPRLQMLMKNQQVLPDGTYVPAKVSVLTYGTMMFVRVMLIREATNHLAKAATIATRYAAVRRQSPIDPNQPEPQIMDHITQQMKLFPQIAKAIVFKSTSEIVGNMYNNVTGEIEQGNVDRLPEMHALSCCLKAICSADAAAGIETCRLACGGHGYMDSSSFPTIYGMATAICTYEGENTVMLLQTARYLVKVYGLALKGQKLVPTVSYLNKAINMKQFVNFDGSPLSIVLAFEFAAANKIRIAYERMEEKRQKGLIPEVIANMCGLELTQAAELHGRAFLARSAYTLMQDVSSQMSKALSEVLKYMLELYLLDAFLKNLGDFLRCIDLNQKDISKLELRLQQLLKEIRPNAVALVDGFGLHDRMLNSVLGAYDGNVYERIFEAAKLSPLNQEPVNKSFHQYLKPFMQSKL